VGGGEREKAQTLAVVATGLGKAAFGGGSVAATEAVTGGWWR